MTKENTLIHALDLRDTGQYEDAILWVKSFLEHSPDNLAALALLSQLFLLTEQPTSAAEVISEAAAISPELPVVYRGKARVLLAKGEFTEALEQSMLACKKDAHDLENLLVLASCFSANRMDLKASEIIAKVLEVHPYSAEAYAIRISIHLRANDLRSAIEDAERSVEIKPHLTQIWSLLGSLYFQDGDVVRAISAVQVALEKQPGNTKVALQLAQLQLSNECFHDATITLKTALELDDENAELWEGLGMTYQCAESFDDAKKAYTKALDINPNSYDVLSNLGCIAMKFAEWNLAESYFQRALELNPSLTECINNLATCFTEVRRFEESVATYQKALRLKPNLAELHNNLSVPLKELGRLEEAELCCRRAIELRSDYANAYTNLGKITYLRGQSEKAVQFLHKAICLDPSQSEPRVLAKIFQSDKFQAQGFSALNSNHTGSNYAALRGLGVGPIVIERPVDEGLIETIYETRSCKMDSTRDTRFGDGVCTIGFDFLEGKSDVVRTVKSDLLKILTNIFHSEILIVDSFFNVLSGPGGTTPHTHLSKTDMDPLLGISALKYSLVYYLNVGDQTASDPGTLVLYDPSDAILPREGLIIVLPADRKHSASYNGSKDRILLGINFYSI